MLRLALTAFLTILGLSPASAHTRSESFSSWRTSDRQVIGVLQVDAHRVTQLARLTQDMSDLPGLFVRHVAEAVRARQEGVDCAADTPRSLTAETGLLRVEMTFDCPKELGAVAAEIDIAVFREGSPGHVHYVRLEQPSRDVHEAVVAGSRTSITIGGPPRSAPEGLLTFVRIGLEHVLTGLDHMAFLLALTLLAGRPWNAALAASGFTVGHSLTLGLVAFGWLRPNAAAIEALIGFTIAVTAALLLAERRHEDAGLLRSGRVTALFAALAIASLPVLTTLAGHSAPPWPVYAGAALFAAGLGWTSGTGQSGSGGRIAMLLATAFGLVHGAGFAGGLLDLELPKERLLGALLGFNLGVEAGQLIVLGACAAAGAAVRRLPGGWLSLGREATGAGLVGLGVYWLVARSFL